MPCMKCANGKYKYGEGGRCQFDTLSACNAAAAAIHARERKDIVNPCLEVANKIDALNREYREYRDKLLK